MSKLRVGVLASGTGTLLQAILEAQDERYEVAVVVSDRPGVQALERAHDAGVDAAVCSFKEFASREDFSEAVAREQTARGVGLSASAGFARMLSPNYFPALGVPYMNSHPALLPSFPGPHGVRDALAHGVKVTGTTIIFADEGMDTGPIILQEAVAIDAGDTEETLHARIKAVEHRLYPQAIRLFAEGRLKVEGRRVHIL